MAQRNRAGRRVVRREVLERADRQLLARYLALHDAFFAAHSVSLAAEHPRRLHALLHDATARPAAPPELLHALKILDTLATPAGAEELVRLDQGPSPRLPRATYGAEDLALYALLHTPDLAARASVAAAREADHKFAEYAPPPGPAPKLRVDDGALAELRALLAAKLEALDHTAFCEISVSSNGDEAVLEIDHGSPPRTRDLVDKVEMRVAHVTDISARRACARLDRRTSRLCIRAGTPRVREIIRRAFGEVFAGDGECFRAQGLYDLSPFRDVAAALATDGVPALERVELHEIVVTTADGASMTHSRPHRDLCASSAWPATEAALAHGEPASVRVYLKIKDRARPVRLVVSADDTRTVVEFDRDDPEVVEVVAAYLRARGVLSDDADVAATTAEAQ